MHRTAATCQGAPAADSSAPAGNAAQDAPRAPDPCGHARSVSGMFGRIADWYDLLNRVLSGGLDMYWRHRLVRHVTPGPTGRVLDLAAGTLDVSLEIMRQHPGVRVPALDFCRPMLQRGRGKLFGETARAIWPVTADGRRLPLADASVDCVTIAFGIRNIVPRAEAFAEILRVLVPGGRLCVLEFGTGKTPVWRGLYNFYLNRLLPLVGKAVSGDAGAYRYLADTIMAFPTADELAGEMTAAGFGRVFHLPLTSGIVRLHVAEKPRSGGVDRRAGSGTAGADPSTGKARGKATVAKPQAAPVATLETPTTAEPPAAPPVAAPQAAPIAKSDASTNAPAVTGKARGGKTAAARSAVQATLPGAAAKDATKKKRATGGAKAGKKAR